MLYEVLFLLYISYVCYMFCYIFIIYLYTYYMFLILLYISIFIFLILNLCGNVFNFILCIKLLECLIFFVTKILVV